MTNLRYNQEGTNNNSFPVPKYSKLITIQSQDGIYIRRVMLIYFLVFKARKIVICLIITIIIIFLNISCRIKITGYIYIITFSTRARIRPAIPRGDQDVQP